MESKEEIYKTQIKKKIDELAKICYQNNVPCFFVVAIGDKQEDGGKKKRLNINDSKLDLKVMSYLPETMNADTKDPVFSDLVNVVNGFTTVPPADRSVFALDADDLALPPDLGYEDETELGQL